MKIINIFGGPGAGKSVTRSRLFTEMKIRGYTVEEVHEYAKEMVYEDRFNILDDQLYVFAKQHRKMKRLNGKVDYCITDSPLLLSNVYLKDVPYAESFTKLVLDMNREYDNINVYIERNHPYQTYGRYQDENGANEKSDEILLMLEMYNIDYHQFQSTDNELINKILKLL